MFVLRLLGLLLFTAFCVAMGSIPSNEANALAKFFGPLALVAAPLLYFLPTIEAKIRSHHNLGSLAALNFFLGWIVPRPTASSSAAWTASMDASGLKLRRKVMKTQTGGALFST